MVFADERPGQYLDLVYALLRVGSLAAGVSYSLLSLAHGSERDAALVAFGFFLGYSVLLYAAGWRLLRLPARDSFYAVTALLDLLFVAALMHITGDAASPFYRALYLWIAMIAFYFGYRAALVASLVALAVFTAFQAANRFRGDAWLIGVQAGGMLMHGAVIGYLVERQRQRAGALHRMRDELSSANQRLREEQAKLVQAEKLSSIGLLASGVAHEINNPLSGLMGCLKALREGSVPEGRREEYFATMRDGLERIRVTVQGLLDYAKARRVEATELDAAEVTAACLRLLSTALRKKNVQADLAIARGELHVLADRSQLMQALVNVLMNAAYVAPEGSTIVIAAARRPERVGIRITDHGPGIPPDLLPRVCDPFFTTKPEGEGTGLGLAITLGIVRAHGGDLEIDSAPGRGTTVTLWLPGGTADAGYPAG